MTDILRTICGTDSVSRGDAYEVFEVLVPLHLATPDDADPDDSETVRCSFDVISRMDPDDLLTVIFDWWFIASTCGRPSKGRRSPHGHAFHLPASVTPSLREAMRAVVGLLEQDIRVSPRRWVRAAAALERGLRELDESPDLDIHGPKPLRSERDAWDDLLAQLNPVVVALRQRQPTEAFRFDERAFKRRWRRVVDDPPRWSTLMNRARDCVGRVNSLVRLHTLVEPWIRRPRPPVVEPESLPADVIDALGPLGTAPLDPVLAIGTPSHGLHDAPTGIGKVADRLAEIASDADETDVSRLASIAGDWLDATQATVPVLAEMMGRRAAVATQAEQLRKAGVDVDEALGQVHHHQVSASERLLTQAEQRRDHQRHGVRLTRTLERLRAEGWDGPVPERWAERLEDAAEMLNRGNHADAERTLEVLQSQLHASQRAVAIADVERLRNELDRLDAPTTHLVEIDEHLADLANHADRSVDADLVQRAEERLDSLIDQRRREVEYYLHAAHDAMKADRDPILVDALPGIERRLTEATSDLRDGELMAAHQLASDVLVEIESHRVHRWTAAEGEDVLVEHVVRYCTQQLFFDPADVRRFYVATKTKPFVILAGLTGSGKSTIARLFAAALGADSRSGRFRRVAVRPDWIDQSEVLGSINPFSNRFEPGWLAEVARRCEQNRDELHLVLLDEMNLAPVEQYLAEFLSAIEESRSGSDSAILPLYSPGASPLNAEAWPASLPFPSNLIVIGTVNVDETTRVLSGRVLDRANVLQLSVAVSDAHHRPVTRQEPPWYVPFREWDAVCEGEPDERHHDFLVDVGEVLHSMGIGLGQRAHVELERFVANARGVLDPELSLDLGMLQRVVPKIRGFKRDLLPGLVDLHKALVSMDCRRSAKVIACWTDDGVSDDEFLDGTDTRIGLLG